MAKNRNALDTFQAVLPDRPGPPQGEEQDKGGKIRHDPHGPVLDKDIRHVVTGAVLLLVLLVDGA